MTDGRFSFHNSPVQFTRGEVRVYDSGQFALKVNGELPLELSVHTTDRIGELIFDDLTEQGLVPGSSVNISMDMMLYSPDQAKEELGLRRAR